MLAKGLLFAVLAELAFLGQKSRAELAAMLSFAVLAVLVFLGLKPRAELAAVLSFAVLAELVSFCHDAFLVDSALAAMLGREE